MSSLHEQLIQGIMSGVIAVDTEGIIVATNEAAGRYLRLESKQLLNGTRLETLPTAGPMVGVMREVIETGRPVTRRDIYVEVDKGKVREIGLSASPIGDKDSPAGVVFLFTDMTERRELERIESLNHQLMTLGELTAGVVHELRNPVSVISGMAELLMRRLGEQDERYSAANTILNEATAIEESIAQFLGLAKPFDMSPGKCSPDEVAQRAVQLCQRRAKQREVRLAYAPRDGLPVMYADGERIAQAIGNVITNAIEAVKPGGNVELTIREDAQQVIFDVTDDGPGIHLLPGEDLFKPFFTKKEGGTGLGLPIVKRIVAAHGGAVTYENTDSGARFMIRVPTSP